MPRRKILGPATAGQVLDYFRQSNFETTVVIYELVTEVVKERKLMTAQNTKMATLHPGSSADAPKRRKQAKDESLPL